MCCDCFFCGDGKFLMNKKIGLSGTDWGVYEDENVFITPDVSPVLKGHFLIVSKMHINSFGNGSEEIFLSLQKAKEILVEKVYCQEKILFFEHGAVISHTAGGCIDHAHLHAIPLDKDIDVDAYIDKHKLLDTPKFKMNYEVVHEFAKEKKPYIAYGYNKDDMWIRNADWLPTQFFRLLISDYYPGEYNWKLACKSEHSKKLFRETMKMAALLSKNSRRECENNA